MTMVSYLTPAMKKMIRCSSSRIEIGCRPSTLAVSWQILRQMKMTMWLEKKDRVVLIFQVQLDLQRLSPVVGILIKRAATTHYWGLMLLITSLHTNIMFKVRLVLDTIWQTTLTKIFKKTLSLSRMITEMNIDTGSSLSLHTNRAPLTQILFIFKAANTVIEISLTTLMISTQWLWWVVRMAVPVQVEFTASWTKPILHRLSKIMDLGSIHLPSSQ